LKNKILITIILIFVFGISILSGFFIGRYLTIRRHSRYFSRFVSLQIVMPEMERFRNEMRPLMEEKIRKEEILFIAITKGDSDFAYRISDEIAEIEREMREKSIRHIMLVSKDIPPDMRKEFIRGVLMRDIRKPVKH